MQYARVLAGVTGQTEHVYGDTHYAAGSRERERRVIIKAEVVYGEGKEPKDNPRFVITNMKQSPQWLYEKVYCQRGEIENRIKELHALEIDRTSCSRFWANQFRVLLTAAAYILMQEYVLAASRPELVRNQCLRLAGVLRRHGFHPRPGWPDCRHLFVLRHAARANAATVSPAAAKVSINIASPKRRLAMKIASTVARYLPGAHLPRLWPQWILEFHAPATTVESRSYPVPRRGFDFALYRRSLCGADHRRSTVAGGSFCAARPCSARAGFGQHPQLPPHHGPGRHRHRIDHDDSVGGRLPALPVKLRPDFSAAFAAEDNWNVVRSGAAGITPQGMTLRLCGLLPDDARHAWSRVREVLESIRWGIREPALYTTSTLNCPNCVFKRRIRNKA